MPAYTPIKVWKGSYNIDFTAKPAQNLRTGGDGTKIIDGNSWTWTNDVNAQSADLIPGTGLLIACNTTNSSGNPTARTAPVLSIPFSSLVPNYDVFRGAIRVMARVLTSAAANVEGVRLAVEDAVSPTTQAVSVFKGVSGSVNTFIVQASVNGTLNPAAGSLTSGTVFTDDIIGIIFEAPRSWEVDTGLYPGDVSILAGLPASLPRFRVSEIMDMASPIMITSDRPAFSLSVQSGNTAGTVTGTFTHLQVDYCANNVNI